MTEPKVSLLIVCSLACLLAIKSRAQEPQKTGSTAQASSSSPDGLGAIVAQALVEGQTTVPPSFVEVYPPQSPTLEDRAGALWTSATTATDNFFAGVRNDPWGAGATFLSAGLDLVGAYYFNPAEISLQGEILGDWPKGFGVGPDLLSGGLSGATFASTASDILGGMATDFSTAARDGGRTAPMVYNLLTGAKSISDLAEQGEKSSTPEVLSTYTPPESLASPGLSPSSFNPALSEESEIIERVEQARQGIDDLAAQRDQLLEQSADYSQEIKQAQGIRAALQAQDKKAYAASLQQAQSGINYAMCTHFDESAIDAAQTPGGFLAAVIAWANQVDACMRGVEKNDLALTSK